MVKTIKIVTAVATLLTLLGSLGLTFWALVLSNLAVEPRALTTVVGLALSVLFSFFTLNDYRYFFGQKNEPTE